MSKQMTPILRPLRDGSGTIYAFPSAIEDIALNLDLNSNKIALSRFVVLNLPDADTSDENVSANHFNFTNIPGLANQLNNNTTLNIRQKIAVALQNYLMNFETTMVNQADYDYSASATISERVFWKFLKETGAIRWQPLSAESATLRGKRIYIEEEESELTGYKRVVQSIGEISGGNSVSGEFGMYNETYVNIPSTYGASQVFFQVVEDNNYRLGEVYTSDDKDYLSGRNSEMSKETYTLNSPAYDVLSSANAHDAEEDICAYAIEEIQTEEGTIDVSVCPWYQYNDSTNDVPYSYFTEEEFDVDTDGSINFLMGVYEGNNPNIAPLKRKFLRSRLDGVQVVSDIDDIDNIFDQLIPEHNYISYDSINVDQTLIHKENYDFNAILLYYTIYDKDNHNELATNLFGIIFLNSPQVEKGDAALNTGDSLKFNLPVYNKKKSNGAGSNSYFGNGYSFKVNIRSLSIYDNTDAYIQDETTSASLYTEDFNDVVFRMNKAVDTLQKNSVILGDVFKNYAAINRKVDSTSALLNKLDKKIQTFALRKFADIQSENISVSQDFEVNGTSSFSGLFKIGAETNFDIPSFDVSTFTAAEVSSETADFDYLSVRDSSVNTILSNLIDVSTLNIVGDSFSLNGVREFADFGSKILSESKMIESTQISPTLLAMSQDEAIEIIKNTTVFPYSASEADDKQFEIVPTTFDVKSEAIQKYKKSLYYGDMENKAFVNYINYVPVIVLALKKLFQAQ